MLISTFFFADFFEFVKKTYIIIFTISLITKCNPGTGTIPKMSVSMVDASQSFGLISSYSTANSQVSAFNLRSTSALLETDFMICLQMQTHVLPQEIRDWRDYKPAEQYPVVAAAAHHCGSHGELPYAQCHFPLPMSRAWPEPPSENGKI